MTMTFKELKEELKQWPEDLLLELLNLSSEEIVEAFSDEIYDKQEELRHKIGQED